ncbi:MAG TPA: RidA family protein [Polyangiales bacterium]|nr:RidA family protein [Polyangiales bacterium]
MAEIENKLAALGLSLPPPPKPIASFIPYRVAGGIVYLAGQTCERDGSMAYQGRVGIEVELADARMAAQLCGLNLLAALRAACAGDLDRVARCIRVGGYVQSSTGFAHVPRVVDGASELFIALWGDEGRHARTAIGVATLPLNAAVEVDAIFELHARH